MDEQIELRPAAGWDLLAINHLGGVALTIRYLVSPMEAPTGAHPSPNYLFHTAQLRELAHAMLRAADTVESAGMSSPPGPTN
ncbi:hypothetical protein LVB77_14710 [Lysobacter sp. 5GHs7-4]|uniref:hypothetical protein n=1 Tax=Lysobacter sp. 5GHs7-4 TaxID=2904253 RepID=UPI001E4B209C|nr:hypothetical protein [Lysobacter sp. 5GHs7-4]UHQ21917.1 hypothetical protein LVB77_14710 [Lysobacter sp. 5GHs7-4]